MGDFLSKLTNLGYEFFGVLLPGLIGCFFFVFLWAALGPVAPIWSFDYIPELKVDLAVDLMNNISGKIIVLVITILIIYFFGHVLLWISRRGKKVEDEEIGGFYRMKKTLLFSIPKPKNNFDKELLPLFEVIRPHFSPSNVNNTEWRQVYPVVKAFLSQSASYSLVSTYQNKYTLHRSIASVGALFAWASFISAAGALFVCSTNPRFGMLIVLFAISLIIAWVFSSSYLYHWKMFGNTLITEAFSLLEGLKKDDLPIEK